MHVHMYMVMLFILGISCGTTKGLQICGNFCGPGWCNGKALSEASCDGSVAPDPEVFQTDSCCRDHDMCCGHGDRSLCNDRLIDCITGGSRGLGASGIWDDYVCGTSTTSAATIAEFFESLGFLSHLLANKSMCCAELCALPLSK